MPILFFLFWGIVLAFVGGGWLAAGGFWLWARKRKGAPKWIAGTIFAGFSLVAVLGAAGIGYALIRSSVPRFVFEDTFHEKPPPGTVVLHGSSSGFADSAGTVIAFHSDRATFDRLRPAGLEPVPRQDYDSFGHRKASWWREPWPTTEIWMKRPGQWDGHGREDRDQRFASEWTIMTWDVGGLVQYCWEGID